MKLSEEILKQLQSDVEKSKDVNDLLGKDGAIKKLIKHLLEEMLGAELSEELGYDKHDKASKLTRNRRNGNSRKTVKSEFGPIELDIPRDRNGEFDPVLIKKYQKDLGVIEEKILSMYAKGMSTRDIGSHIEDIYGIEISPSAISRITEKVLTHVTEWQSRPLERIYPIVFFDAIHFKVREDGKVLSKAAYTVLSIDCNGCKDLLGIWIGQAEGANFWLSVLSEIKQRGVEDILICCIDGLKGFPEAIETIFPKADIQVCIIHQIRHSLKYIASKNKREFMKDLKLVYQAPSIKAAESQLDKLDDKWGDKYELIINSWRNNWPRLSAYFKYPPDIRKIIYTTNIVENVHRQMRKVTKTKSLFPHDDALRKIMFMAYTDIKNKWKEPVKNWPNINLQLAIVFEGRIDTDLP